MTPEWVFDYRIWLKIGGIGLFLCLALFFRKVIFSRVLLRMKSHLHTEPLALEMSKKIYTVIVYLIGLLFLLQVFGIDIFPILTFGGIGAAVLALAGRDVIANFFGGIVLYGSGSFSLYDVVELPAKKIKGRVEQIGWCFTTLRDQEKRPLYVPNSLFATELLLNHTRSTHRYIEEKIRMPNGDGRKVKKILGEIRDFLQHQEGIDRDQPIQVFLLSIHPHELEIAVTAYTGKTQDEEFMELRQKILLEIQQFVT